ncbi:MAG: hypothetical protein JJ891_06750 [Rhizobiaceae bacterium]|nr:hypothetical protein [Rhizobiaceae bacterium]
MNSTKTPVGKEVPVHKEGHEGVLMVDSLTGEVTTPTDQKPEWADGFAVALLAERTGYYESRLGTELSDELRSPEMFDADDLGWIGLDAEGDEVEIEASGEKRMTLLAEELGVDRENLDEDQFSNATAEVEVDYSYITHPTDEATLSEAEGITFEEKQAAQAGK